MFKCTKPRPEWNCPLELEKTQDMIGRDTAPLYVNDCCLCQSSSFPLICVVDTMWPATADLGEYLYNVAILQNPFYECINGHLTTVANIQCA